VAVRLVDVGTDSVCCSYSELGVPGRTSKYWREVRRHLRITRRVSYSNYLNEPLQSPVVTMYRGVHKSLARRPTSRCILFDGETISFDASLVIYMYSKTCLKRNAIIPVFFFSFSQVSVLQRVVF